jgi:hypothetical protein
MVGNYLDSGQKVLLETGVNFGLDRMMVQKGCRMFRPNLS